MPAGAAVGRVDHSGVSVADLYAWPIETGMDAVDCQSAARPQDSPCLPHDARKVVHVGREPQRNNRWEHGVSKRQRMCVGLDDGTTALTGDPQLISRLVDTDH